MLAIPDLTQEQKDLLAAADYIEKNGWCQHRRSYKGAVCIIGAISIVTTGKAYGYDWEPFGSNRLSKAATILFKKLNTAPWMFNDCPGRTKQEVIDVLRESAFN